MKLIVEFCIRRFYSIRMSFTSDWDKVSNVMDNVHAKVWQLSED